LKFAAIHFCPIVAKVATGLRQYGASFDKGGFEVHSIRITTLALLAGTIAGGASAADLPSRKAPLAVAPAPMLINWSGFYVGLNAGGTFGGNNNVSTIGVPGAVIPVAGAAPIQAAAVTSLTGTGSGGNSKIGFIGGGQIGYNWQFGSMVAGIEADIQGIAANSSATNIVGLAPIAGAPPFAYLGSQTVTNQLDWLGTLRGRLGFLATPTWLLYGTGGLAYGGVRSTSSVFQTITPSPGAFFGGVGSMASSSTRVGWTIGAGAEWMFAPNWSAKLEYLYYDLGSYTYNSPAVEGSPAAGFPVVSADFVQTRVRNNGHIVRMGLNYHFNWGSPGPVVASY
jgi:outer membrane immunogenic protein